MDAAVALMSLVRSDGSGAASARESAGRSSEPAEPFEDILQQASETRQAAEREESRSERSEDPQTREIESDREDRDEEDEKESEKAKEPRQHAEVVVEGGINLVVPQTAGQEAGIASGQGDGAAALVAGEAEVAGLSAQMAGKAEAQAKLAAMQAKAQADQAQSIESAGLVQNGEGGETDQSQTLDRGAAAKAALDRLAAGAKGESGHRLMPVDPAKAEAEAKAKAAAVEGALKLQQVVRTPEATVEKPVEVQQLPASSQTGAGKSEAMQGITGLGGIEAKAEGASVRNAFQAQAGNEPAVNRQEVMDQVVRSAKLHLDRGLSRFEMRLDPPSLGQIKVVMDLKDGALNISFKVENQSVKEALQSSLPQLREALAVQGLTVDGFDVQGSGRGLQQSNEGRQEPGFGQWSGGSSSPEGELTPAGNETVRAARGLVDLLA